MESINKIRDNKTENGACSPRLPNSSATSGLVLEIKPGPHLLIGVRFPSNPLIAITKIIKEQ
jgi:hypothetical protein